MQLTCCGTTRNFRKIRLQSSLLNCDYTLQVLQHVSTRLYQRLHCNDVYVCFYYPNNTQVQTATFQTNGLRSVRLYVHNTLTLKYDLDIRILTCTPALGRLMLRRQIILARFDDNVDYKMIGLILGENSMPILCADMNWFYKHIQ